MNGHVDPRQAWERLREYRWSPPSGAGDGARCRTFVSALDQMEQIFHAAAMTDLCALPLQVFHGLSQAGRAIAAAAGRLGHEDWRLVAPGIATSGGDVGVADIEIRTDPPGSRSSFVRLSELLHSPVWERVPVRLEDVWDTLPVNLGHPLTDRHRSTPLYAAYGSSGEHDQLLLGQPAYELPPWSIGADSPQILDGYLAQFSETAQDSHLPPPSRPQAVPGLAPRASGGRAKRWFTSRRRSNEAASPVILPTATRSYMGQLYRFPVIAPLPRELHPLMAWWAILYALSRLAHDDPATWALHISFVGSRHALPLEQLFESALTHLPVLIADTIEDLAIG
ncbi:YaaC family protein [Streptomyces sp. NPDC001922]|uniref:YaaC family protein n=1 Tax=Streptomyces sp. NPDC001922 TaxID=3364624 RepID=UPI0036829F61